MARSLRIGAVAFVVLASSNVGGSDRAMSDLIGSTISTSERPAGLQSPAGPNRYLCGKNDPLRSWPNSANPLDEVPSASDTNV